ncbi:MAG TPA: DUF2231 domain-containing protein [Anaeromyxobacteraceae bacterium]|nr:DUF2231 domain-containing protein [Anaeromyxobacteraceae bacterium]
MPMLTHELHPSLVHAPLGLLPTAAIVDLSAAFYPRAHPLHRLGRNLWWATAVTGLVTGLAGMAASQEVDLTVNAADPERARDRMFLHGFGNLMLVGAALGVAVYRTKRKANLTTAISGLAATGAAIWTAYLGGELVYAHGAGVKAMGPGQARVPALFSREAPGRLARDAVRGFGWLVRRASAAFSGRQKILREALGPIGEEEVPLPTRVVEPPTQH